MLEQNTDRLMAVVGALALGAIIIAFVPGLKDVFNSVLEGIKDQIAANLPKS